MPKRKYYIPLRDDDFYTFQHHLIDKVVVNKVAWGISDAVVNPLTSRRAEYEPAYHKSQEKSNRTSGDVVRHRQLRKLYEKELRVFAKAYLMFNPAVSFAQRMEMGLTVRDTEPSPRPAIADRPMVGFKPLGGGSLEVTCMRQTDQTRPSMHPAADAIECRFILLPVGEAPPTDTEQCPKIHISKKAHFFIPCGVKNAGKCFYGFFRWVNLTNPANNGPWSNARSAVIA